MSTNYMDLEVPDDDTHLRKILVDLMILRCLELEDRILICFIMSPLCCKDDSLPYIVLQIYL